MCLNKSIRLAEKGWDTLQATKAARQQNGGLASKAALPRDTVEHSHVKAIAASVKAMQGKGYVVQLLQVQPDGPLTHVKITGPTNFVWEAEDLRELLDECPSYAKIEDYALAVHEQACE